MNNHILKPILFIFCFIETFTNTLQASTQVEIFVTKTTNLKIYPKLEIKIHDINLASRELTKLDKLIVNMPPARAHHYIVSKFNDGTLQPNMQRITQGISSIELAKSYKLTKYPAIVFNKNLIIYPISIDATLKNYIKTSYNNLEASNENKPK